MRRMTFLALSIAAFGILTAGSAQAQYWGGGTIISGGPALVTVGGPTYLAPTVYGNPYATVVSPAPVVVERRTVVANPFFGAPATVVAPRRVLVAPGPRVIRRPGWGWGPGYGYGPMGPRARVWRGW